MIQTTTFALSKDMARLPFGADGRQAFYYLGDLKRQWEASNLAGKALELIGSESVPLGHLAAVKERLGPLSAGEQRFLDEASAFLSDVSRLISTVPPPFDPAPDLYETILDVRVLSPHVKFPCRVLDIGAGAGRHMLNLMLRPEFAVSSYCAIDSIGLPYVLQNAIAGALSVRDHAVTFTDTLDFEFARREVIFPAQMPPGSLWHAPLWHADKLPDRAFDLIICNYVLDEIPAEDFRRVVGLIARCLAPEGVVYCRGGQQKSMLRDLQLFGYGTYHQQDITASLLAAGLKVKDCELVTATMTRIFVRAESQTHRCAETGYAAIGSDVPLVEAMQRDFIRENVGRIAERRLRTVIWSDPGHAAAQRYLGEVVRDIDLCGITSDHIMHEGPSLFGSKEFPLAGLAALGPQAVIIAGTRLKLAVRELADTLKPIPLGPVLSFNYPIAVCYL